MTSPARNETALSRDTGKQGELETFMKRRVGPKGYGQASLPAL